MLRVADGRRGHAVLLGEWDQQIERLARLHLAESVAGVEREHAARAAIDRELRLGIDQSCFDALQINIQPGDAVGRNAMQIRIDQHLGKERRIVGGHTHAGRELRDEIFQIVLSDNGSLQPRLLETSEYARESLAINGDSTRAKRAPASCRTATLHAPYALRYSLVITNSRWPSASAAVKRPFAVRTIISISASPAWSSVISPCRIGDTSRSM